MVYLGKPIIKEMHLEAKPEIFKFAQDLRKNQTASEQSLWKVLRKYRNSGYIFRRQHPLGKFIADFYCHKLKLVIEVDGEVHSGEEAQEHDAGRTFELEKFGIKVIRFSNEQILHNENDVMSQINILIEELSSPSPPGEGDKRG